MSLRAQQRQVRAQELAFQQQLAQARQSGGRLHRWLQSRPPWLLAGSAFATGALLARLPTRVHSLALAVAAVSLRQAARLPIRFWLSLVSPSRKSPAQTLRPP